MAYNRFIGRRRHWAWSGSGFGSSVLLAALIQGGAWPRQVQTGGGKMKGRDRRWCRLSLQRTGGRGAEPRSRRLRLEPLEDRRLLTLFSFEHKLLEHGLDTQRAAAGRAVAIDGDYAVVGAPHGFADNYRAGAAYVYLRNDQGTPGDASDDTWEHQATLSAADAAPRDTFGLSVAISGDTVVVGAFVNYDTSDAPGSAYVFTRNGTTWTQQQKLAPSGVAALDYFGCSVSIDADTVVIGADGDDDGGSASGSAYVFTRSAGAWTEQQKLTASDAAFGDYFGCSVSVAGDTIAVGAVGDDDLGSVSGSAYVFTRSDGTWAEQQKLTASDGAADDLFGSVSISGQTIVVGASGGGTSDRPGSAYVFTRTDNTWTEQQRLIASDGAVGDHFGSAVSLSGETIVVGAQGHDHAAPDSGAAYVFARSGTTWTEQQKLTASDGAGDHQFGQSVSISVDTIIVGAPRDDDAGTRAGAGYAYGRNGNTWTESATKLIYSRFGAYGVYRDEFAHSVAGDGDYLVVGAPGCDRDPLFDAGEAQVFVRNDNGTPGDVADDRWDYQATLAAPDAAAEDQFGYSVSISGETIVVGAPLDDVVGSNSGSAYVFTRSGTSWSLQQKLVRGGASGWDYLGCSVAISGDTIVVGARGDDHAGIGSGSAFVFARSQGVWTEQQRLGPRYPAPLDLFGFSVAISGETIVVGAPRDDEAGEDSGAVYDFDYKQGRWLGGSPSVGDDTAAGDHFGASVSVSGDTVVVGAPMHDDLGTDSGAAYVVQGGRQKLIASDTRAGDYFGSSVWTSGDMILVGADGDNPFGDDSGSAYLFTPRLGSWNEVQQFAAPDGAAEEHFGASVWIGGHTLVVGAPWDDDCGFRSGSAYAFGTTPWDFGDADYWAVTLLPDGARHRIVPGGPFLGASVECDPDGLKSGFAWGDDREGTDDEDGVTFTTLLVPGDPSAGVDVDMRASPVGGVLNAWIDFNYDRDWADPGEQIFSDEPLTAGVINSLTFPVPAAAVNGRMFARFRVSTETGLSFDGPASDGEVEDYLVYVVSDLGPVDFLLLSGEDPAAWSVLYGLETVRDGYLTLEALSPAGSREPYVVLYDNNFSRLNAGSRIDRQVASGEDYFFVVSTTSPGIDLRICNLVQHSGTSVTVCGTDGADQFEFDASASRIVAVNGVRYEFDDHGADTFAFHGSDGDDAIVLDGNDAADALELWPGSGSLLNDDRHGSTENDYHVEFTGVEAVTANGNDGVDVALLHDDPTATDTFKAWPQSATFSGSGFSDQVLGFEEVNATATLGNRDVAYLYDGDRDDTFYAGPSSPEGTVYRGTTSAGQSFANSVDGFYYVHAYSWTGGSDAAYLYDNPTTADRLRAWPQGVIHSGGGFYDRVLGFEEVHTTASPGNQDVAYLYDGDRDDTFYAGPSSPEGTVYRGTTSAGQSFANSVEGFYYVHAYSREGGSDAAYLYDNAATADRLRAWPNGAIYSGGGFYNRVLNFEEVHATASPGNQDVAYLYDGDGDDTFHGGLGSPQGTVFTGATSGGQSFANSVDGFDYVHAYSRTGGNDTAYLYDSPANDRFGAWSQMARIYGAGFYCRTLDFEQGKAIALERSDTDQAWAHEPSPWQAIGDWEGGDMTPSPLPLGGIHATRLETAWAAWAATGESDGSDSEETEGTGEETDPAAVDWIIAGS
jgi:hypothetical protein